MANVINFNDEDKNKEQGNDAVSGAISPLITPAAAPTPQEATPNKQASSGQFTNIQKYMNANKGAGEQISGNVQQKIQNKLQPGQEQQASDAAKFKAGAEQAQQTFSRGNEYLSQLGSPAPNFTPNAPGVATAPTGTDLSTGGKIQDSGALTLEQAKNPAFKPPQAAPYDPSKGGEQFRTSTPDSFINDQNKLLDFTKIRTGKAIDEQDLSNKANQSQLQAGLNQQEATDLFGRTRSAIGRQGLLTETFNQPNYTQGQQRLDNLFLTGAGQKGINALQQKAKSNVASAGDVYRKASEDVGSLAGISQTNKDLQKGLQDKADILEKGFMSNLESLVPEVNKLRGAEKDRWQKNFDILTGKTQGQMDPDIYEEFKLRTGEHAFNVLTDPNLNLKQIAQVSDRNAAGAQDVSNQGDVDYYKKLAMLSKGTVDASGNFAGPTQDQLLLSKASDLGRAVQANTGEGSLRGKLDTAQNEFLTKALGTNVSGFGSDSGTGGLFGGGSDAHANLQMNLAKYLSGQGVTSSDIVSANRDKSSGALETLANLGFGGASAGGTFSSLGDFVNNQTGASSGSNTAAEARARLDLLRNLTGSLTGAGYGNYVTTGGNKNVDALMQEQLGVDTNRLSNQQFNEYGLLSMTPDEIAEQTVNPYRGIGQPGTPGADAYKSGVLDRFGGNLPPLTVTDQNGRSQYNPELSWDERGAIQYAQALNTAKQDAVAKKARLQAQYDAQSANSNAAQQDILNRARQFTGVNNLIMPSLNYNVAGAFTIPPKPGIPSK